MNLVTMVLACSLYPDNSITNAMVEIGSQNNPLTITIAENGQAITKTFKNEADATSYVNKQIAQGHNVNIGLMQIPNNWITKYPASMDASVSGLFRPCKNMVVATDLLNDATEQCASNEGDKTACALSVYHTGSPTAGLDYAKQVMAYADAHPFIKPPSLLEQVPVPVSPASINAAANANNDATANPAVITPAANATNTNGSATPSATPDNSPATSPPNSDNVVNSDQPLSTQQLNNQLPNDDGSQNNDDSNSANQAVTNDSATLPPVENGSNSDN